MACFSASDFLWAPPSLCMVWYNPTSWMITRRLLHVHKIWRDLILSRKYEPQNKNWHRNKTEAKTKHMDVSKNRDTPKSSILIGCSIINHPFWGTPIFGNTYIKKFKKTLQTNSRLSCLWSERWLELSRQKVFPALEDWFPNGWINCWLPTRIWLPNWYPNWWQT